MVHWDVVPPSHPSRGAVATPASCQEVVRPPHRDDHAHPREAVEHHRQKRPVAQARERAGVDRLEEPRRGFGPGRLPLGFTARDLADDEPVAEHADRGQVAA